MEEQNNQQYTNNGLNKCPYCPCCFCSEADLKRHMDLYGNSKLEHIEEFRKVHGRIEHSSFGGFE